MPEISDVQVHDYYMDVPCDIMNQKIQTEENTKITRNTQEFRISVSESGAGVRLKMVTMVLP